MSGCVCGADEPCEVICDEHGTQSHGWPCLRCQRAWTLANPNTAIAIAKIASGKTANLAAAKKLDAELAPTTGGEGGEVG